MLSRAISTFAKNQVLQKSLYQGTAPLYNFTRFSEKLNRVKSKSNEGFAQPDNDSAMHHVITNDGLNAFITRVYKTTGLGIMGALSTSTLAVSSGLAYTSPLFCGLGGFVMALGGILGSSYMSPNYYSEVIKGQVHQKTSNTPMRLGLYSLGMAGLGLSSSVLFGSLHMINPAILPLSIGITGAVFGSASLYALYKPKDSLLSWGSSLYAGLFGMIGLQLAGALTQLFMGPNLFTFMCHRADCFIGVGLFTAMVAYDTHVAIKQYEMGNADHLGVSIDFALDFWNILTRVAQILGIYSKDD
ncbi:inhibitor of apoptosis-promoting Bax1 protein (macronuclear) [Tetrahymena thermophila SB210]|uniref:Inhibitor of apoptosis-promoting Bax1 protein n=1 Tax=Tetrahymena thermophila (strain SB210) TaxID=312017 RepID=Q22AT9_TETTS|nr:inhibitor of apoptosis-promoting Bax1 protein [Tetrahymena thermophila SB210]EAR82409.1 inhibitor of apoptosis-promoting Bax1 protein [Tetrahymena thermophila SB210]|eukprot:XP_001030072.1 inhibitor of apoptosis-promoting Bax1 protein [Tetrahymena thermophila SB210]